MLCALDHMKNAWGTKEKESIYGIRNSINCLSCECMRLMFFLEQQNLIKSKCWVHHQHIDAHAFGLHSMHFGAFECQNQNYHKHALDNLCCGELVGVSTVHLKSLWWYEKFRSSERTVHCKLQTQRIQIAMMNRTQQYFNWLSAFARQKCTPKSLCTRTHTYTST